jgi:hypothetical protein
MQIMERPVKGSPDKKKLAPGAKRARHKRWTRTALVVTIAAMVGFAVVVVLFLRGCGKDKDVEATRELLGHLAEHIQEHRARTGALPRAFSELVNPASKYHGDPIPVDAYGTRIQFAPLPSPDSRFVLRAAGPDREHGTPDDILWPRDAVWPN